MDTQGPFYRPPDRSMYLLKDEIEKLVKAAKQLEEPQARYLTFMANTGTRPSESNLIPVRQVFPHQNRVQVFTLKQKVGKDGKKPRVERDVDTAPPFSKTLAGWIRGKPPEELIFPFSRWTMWRAFKEAARLAGLAPSYTLYSLRHSRAIYLLEWTKDLQYTSVQMGHSSIAVTSRYLHCIPSKREFYVKSKLGSF